MLPKGPESNLRLEVHCHCRVQDLGGLRTAAAGDEALVAPRGLSVMAQSPAETASVHARVRPRV
jgi:hypothetical protein